MTAMLYKSAVTLALLTASGALINPGYAEESVLKSSNPSQFDHWYDRAGGTTGSQRIDTLQQHVKAITAQGRMVGGILLVMPVFFFFVLYIINPQYANVLLKEREGFIVLCIAISLQIMGWISIKKIVAVRM